ncbi:TPA: glycosyltransferase family 2 protein, partial [Streptococcus suis]|nr:glycosyltransferase family 2 protein [Streptococcus suis]
MSKILLSVIIPVYQVEKYLKRCIDSVLAQKFIDYEIILVDDGSTDSSPAICDAYSAEYPHISVIHKENGGLSDARNVGIKHAAGEYIFFLDSDDWIS